MDRHLKKKIGRRVLVCEMLLGVSGLMNVSLFRVVYNVFNANLLYNITLMDISLLVFIFNKRNVLRNRKDYIILGR